MRLGSGSRSTKPAHQRLPVRGIQSQDEQEKGQEEEASIRRSSASKGGDDQRGDDQPPRGVTTNGPTRIRTWNQAVMSRQLCR